MNKHFYVAGIATVAMTAILAFAAPAHAGGNVHWSVSVGAPVYSQPGVVVYQQPQYIYGAPPSAFPAPPVYYHPAPTYYEAPAPVYQGSPPPVIYYQQETRPHHHHYHGHRNYGDNHQGGNRYHDGRGERAALRR